jgi:site-specific DNA-methyltransferase (adenine-specific)/modification methylase
MIVATFDECATSDCDMPATKIVAHATFTEGLLRPLLPLEPAQQEELVREMIERTLSPGAFKERAMNYRARNDMKNYALQYLGDVGEPYLSQLNEEIDKGAYDKDWKETSEHPKLHKLLASTHEEWERKNSIHLIHGNFYEEVQRLGDGCIDLILTDPPYNIARENAFAFDGRANISQDFGEWDKHAEQEFLASFEIWAREWARLLRVQGSGYVFTSDRYISHLRAALEGAELHVKATIVWHKTNPGTQVVKTNFKSSVEYLLFFTKGEGGHTFNWQGENEMHNFLETPICGGNERLTDSKGKTLHPTQKPEQMIRHFFEISSNRGDTVFDGFAGVGTTGKVAKDRGRKFIGIEQDALYFEAMQRRLAE